MTIFLYLCGMFITYAWLSDSGTETLHPLKGLLGVVFWPIVAVAAIVATLLETFDVPTDY